MSVQRVTVLGETKKLWRVYVNGSEKKVLKSDVVTMPDKQDVYEELLTVIDLSTANKRLVGKLIEKHAENTR